MIPPHVHQACDIIFAGNLVEGGAMRFTSALLLALAVATVPVGAFCMCQCRQAHQQHAGESGCRCCAQEAPSDTGCCGHETATRHACPEKPSPGDKECRCKSLSLPMLPSNPTQSSAFTAAGPVAWPSASVQPGVPETSEFRPVPCFIMARAPARCLYLLTCCLLH